MTRTVGQRCLEYQLQLRVSFCTKQNPTEVGTPNTVFLTASITMRIIRHLALWLLLALLCLSSSAVAQEKPEQKKSAAQLERLRARLQSMADAFPGTLGVAVRDLRAGEEVSINGDRPFPMASVFKIPLMVEIFRQLEAGKFSLDDRLEGGRLHGPRRAGC